MKLKMIADVPDRESLKLFLIGLDQLRIDSNVTLEELYGDLGEVYLDTIDGK